MTPEADSTISDSRLNVPATALFDTDRIWADIETLYRDSSDKAACRRAIAARLSEANVSGRAALAEAYGLAPRATHDLIRSYTALTDKIVLTAYRAATELLLPNPTPTKGERLSVIAVGGYGRGEMAPFSDVDLLFLSPYKLSAWSESVVETILYILWDIKLKIGHATRAVDDCIRLGREDLTIRTALLESRTLGGDTALADELQSKLWASLFKGTGSEFVTKKLVERNDRHKKQGQIRFLLEPNVKEGKGGLRDLQTLFWITKYLSGVQDPREMIAKGYFTANEYEEFVRAERFLWTVRCHLHLTTKRATEQLTFDTQVQIAERLGYEDSDGMRGVEAFMQDYFRTATQVGDLTRILLTKLEAQHVKDQPTFGSRLLQSMPWRRDTVETPEGYVIENGRLAIADDTAFLAEPLNFLRLFEEGLKSEILIHPDAMRLVQANLQRIDEDLRADPEAQRIFLSLLLDYGNPERALRRMNELGVLGAFIPEFQRIVALMQFNMYHHYTVDEHTIQCIMNLRLIERGELKENLPLASSILEAGVNRRVLYVALLLHDLGKGLPEDHSVAGERLARTVAPRLGLNAAEVDTVCWLVRHHLLMSDVAQKRDLSDPTTIRKFADQVKSTQRLNLLTVLTVCDIRGVGPGTWNNWKAVLLRELHAKTRAMLNDGIDPAAEFNTDEAVAAFAKAMPGWTAAEVEAEARRHYPSYWQGLDTPAHVLFAKMLADLGDQDLLIDLKPDPDRDATRASFVMHDHPGIFSRMAGALALAQANVVDARTYTSSDGYATTVFWVQDADGRPYEKSRLTRLTNTIRKTLHGEVVARDALKDRDKIKKRERDFRVPTDISFDNEGSKLYTIIEVDTRDRPGLLYDLTRTLNANNIYIASAVIATYGEQAVDVFYVKDMIGLKLHSKAKQKKIEDALRAAIDRGVQGAMA